MNETAVKLVALLSALTYWHWFALAIILLVLELLTGGGFLFWIAIAAALNGLLIWLIPMTWAYQLLIFAIGSIIVSVVWWWYLRKHPIETDQPNLNRRGEQYVGRIFDLSEPVKNGHGTIKVDDSNWRVECDEDLPAGVKVKIVGVDGVILKGQRV